MNDNAEQSASQMNLSNKLGNSRLLLHRCRRMSVCSGLVIGRVHSSQQDVVRELKCEHSIFEESKVSSDARMQSRSARSERRSGRGAEKAETPRKDDDRRRGGDGWQCSQRSHFRKWHRERRVGCSIGWPRSHSRRVLGNLQVSIHNALLSSSHLHILSAPP